MTWEVGETRHVSISVRGLLRRLGDGKREAKRACAGITDATTGLQVTPEQLHGMLCDELAAGHEALPIGEPCENFSYKTGCPGHRKEAP